MTDTHRYYSYLLRLWKEGSGSPGLWRITLEIPQTHQVLHFSSLSSLMKYLEEKISTDPAAGEGKNNME